MKDYTYSDYISEDKQRKREHNERMRQFRYDLIRKATSSEKEIRKLLEEKFPKLIRFQVIIGNYIVDFLHKKKRLIVEIDGDSHQGNKEADDFRQKWLEAHGYTVLRFHNADVWNCPGKILKAVEEVPPPKRFRRPRILPPTKE